MRGPIPLGRQLLLLERIAVGGMAEVYRAKSFGTHGFERMVAVKRILAAMAEDDEFVRMFVDEARLASSLTHQNIVQIYDFGEQDKLHYIAMEYVAGRDLRTILDRHKKLREPMTPAMACAIIAKVAEALDYAHRKKDPSGKEVKIIHRDVSPQNVILSFEGEVKLCDFGIAKAVTQSTRTQVGVLKGKFAYMSPEQVRGRQIDRRSDIFALGVIFYEMLTGERLFLGESDYSTLEAVRSAKVPPPRQFNPALPARLEEICLRMLTREPADRYQWASEVLEDVTRYLYSSGEVVHAHHLRQYMQEAYAADIEAENAKVESFAHLRMPPPDEQKAVSSMLESLGLVAKRSEPDLPRVVEAESVVGGPPTEHGDVTLEEQAPLVPKPGAPVAGAAKKGRPAHDDLSTTVMSDEDSSTGAPTRDLADPESQSTIAEDASNELAAEIHAAQAALIERLSALGESETIDAKDKSAALPPLPRIIAEGVDDPMFDPKGSNTVIDDPAEEEAPPARGPARPPPMPPLERTPPPEPRRAPTSGATSGTPSPTSAVVAALASRQIKERSRPDVTPPPAVALDGRTPPPLQAAAMAVPIAAAALAAAPAVAALPERPATAPLSGERAQPRMLLAGAALVVMVTIAFLGIVLWNQRTTGASLLVETSPTHAAQVYLDGHLMSESTPIEVDSLPLGEHTIEIRAAGYLPYKQTFNIAENRPHTLSIPLEATPQGGRP